MPNNYYVNLTRELLAKAETDLMKAQDYARQANFPDITVKRIQKAINTVRYISDVAGNQTAD